MTNSGGLKLWACASIGLLHSSMVFAQSTTTQINKPSGTENPVSKSEAVLPDEISGKSLKDYLGITYFMFINGPGLDPDRRDAPPNQLGNASDNGMSSFNVISFKYKFSKRFALDFQTRSQVFFNSRDPWSASDARGFENGEPKGHQTFRWESPRIGISGKLASGDDWNLSGAVNTDFPYILPEPLTGYTASKRTVLLSPGMFANFSYNPKGSRFSVFSVLSPRFLVYSDNEAVTPEELRGGFSWRNKPHLVLSLSPTVNYAFTSKLSASVGTALDLRKQLGSSWNPTDISLSNNSESTAWRFMALPISLGMTYEVNSAVRIFPFVQAFPIAAQRINARSGNQASFMETASVGLWINGTIL